MSKLLAAIIGLPFALRNVKYMWRASTGRWYVLRDAPDDIVEYWATVPLDWFADDDILMPLVIDGRREWALRQRERRDVQA